MKFEMTYRKELPAIWSRARGKPADALQLIGRHSRGPRASFANPKIFVVRYFVLIETGSMSTWLRMSTSSRSRPRMSRYWQKLCSMKIFCYLAKTGHEFLDHTGYRHLRLARTKLIQLLKSIINSMPFPTCLQLSLATLILVAAGCAKQQDIQDQAGRAVTHPVTLKLTSFYNLNAPILGENIAQLAQRVEQASDGSLKFKVYDPGKLVSSMEVLDAVSAGKVDAGYSAPGFWMGKMPAAPLFSSIPFGPDISEYLAWFLGGNGMKLYQEMYDRHGFNVKVLLCGMVPPETSGWFAKPIQSAADFKGLKMRFFGLGGSVMKAMGASVNLLPPSEIFPALEKGVIDATEFSMPTSDEDKGFYKIVKYNYFPGWHQQASALELLINKDQWDALAPSQQALIEMACNEGIIFTASKGEASQADVMIRNVEERGVQNMSWSPEILREFETAWQQVAAEQCAADPFFKKVYDDLTKFRKRYAVWGSKAYLPRAASAE